MRDDAQNQQTRSQRISEDAPAGVGITADIIDIQLWPNDQQRKASVDITKPVVGTCVQPVCPRRSRSRHRNVWETKPQLGKQKPRYSSNNRTLLLSRKMQAVSSASFSVSSQNESTGVLRTAFPSGHDVHLRNPSSAEADNSGHLRCTDGHSHHIAGSPLLHTKASRESIQRWNLSHPPPLPRDSQKLVG
jgi:hypothetical protein